jgi:hypothetical protein
MTQRRPNDRGGFRFALPVPRGTLSTGGSAHREYSLPAVRRQGAPGRPSGAENGSKEVSTDDA